MSYDMSPTGFTTRGMFKGDFGVGNGIAAHTGNVTIAAWVKNDPNWNAARLIEASYDDTVLANYLNIRGNTGSPVYSFRAFHKDTASAAAGPTIQPAAAFTTWKPVVFVYNPGSTSAIIYFDNSSNSVTETATAPRPEYALRYIALGRQLDSNTNEWRGRIAEAAVWEKALTPAEVDSYMTGAAANTIASADLVGYWPLDTENTTQADSSGNSGPSLTLTGEATYYADHPDITGAAVNLKPDTEALYYGATRLDSKTGIEWRMTEGHQDINGNLIASGTTATTSSLGVLQLPTSTYGEAIATTPVVLSLYWEEGSAPAVDRSLIVKTTLVEDV